MEVIYVLIVAIVTIIIIKFEPFEPLVALAHQKYHQAKYYIKNRSSAKKAIEPQNDCDSNNNRINNDPAILILSEIVIGNTYAVKRFINGKLYGIEPSVRPDWELYSILYPAANYNQSKIVEYLINLNQEILREGKASVSDWGWLGVTFRAAKYGNYAVLEKLLDGFLSLKIKLRIQLDLAILFNNLIIIAASYGQNEVIELLIRKHPLNKQPLPQPFLIVNHPFRTRVFLSEDENAGLEPNKYFLGSSLPKRNLGPAMHEAARNGHCETIALLVDHGFSVNYSSTRVSAYYPFPLVDHESSVHYPFPLRWGQTPLMVAVINQQAAAVKKLISIKHQENNEIKLSIDFSLKDGLGEDIIDYIFSLSSKNIYSNKTIIRALLAVEPIIEQLKRDTKRLSHALGLCGDTEIIDELIKNFKISYEIILDAIFQSIVVQKNSSIAVHLLKILDHQFIKKGLNDEDAALHKFGFHCLLDAASGEGLHTLIPILLKMGANINEQCAGSKKTALMFAACRVSNNVDVITQLLAAPNINLNLSSNKNKTALMYALEKGVKENIAILIWADIKNNALCKDPSCVTIESVPKSVQVLLYDIFSKPSFKLVLDKDENFVLSMEDPKIKNELAGIDESIKQLTVSRETIKKVIEEVERQPGKNNVSQLVSLIYEHSPEKTEFVFESLKKMIFGMPDRLDWSYLEKVIFTKIRETNQEIEDDITKLSPYLESPGLTAANAVRRIQKKKDELKRLRTEHQNILENMPGHHLKKDPTHPPIKKGIPETEQAKALFVQFDSLYDKTHLEILNHYLAENLKDYTGLKETLDAAFNACFSFQKELIDSCQSLLVFKSKIKDLLIQYHSGIKNLQKELREQEKARHQTELKKLQDDKKAKVDLQTDKKVLNEKEQEDSIIVARALKRQAWFNLIAKRKKEKDETDLKRRREKESKQKGPVIFMGTTAAQLQEPKTRYGASRVYSSRMGLAGGSGSAGCNDGSSGSSGSSDSAGRLFKRTTGLNFAAPIEHFVKKQEELEKLTNIIQSLQEPMLKNQKENDEDIMVLRYALLGTIARIMEHSKKMPNIQGLSREDAVKCRDRIFHGQHHLFNEMDMILFNNKLKADNGIVDPKSFQHMLHINEMIIDLALKLIIFLKNKGNKMTKPVASTATASQIQQPKTEFSESPLDSKLLADILRGEEPKDPSIDVCLAELKTSFSRLLRLKKYVFKQHHYASIQHGSSILEAAFGFLFAKLGIFASVLKRKNFQEYTKNNAAGLLDTYIDYGNSFRHGEDINLEEVLSIIMGLEDQDKKPHAIKIQAR